MRHIWTVVCKHAVIDKDTNLISLLDVLEEITIFDKPKPGGLVNFPIEFMSLWIRDDLSKPCKGIYRMRYIKPSGENISIGPEIGVDLSEFERSRNKLSFQGVRVDQGGEINFIIEVKTEDLNWLEIAKIPIKFNFIEREKQPQVNSDIPEN